MTDPDIDNIEGLNIEDIDIHFESDPNGIDIHFDPDSNFTVNRSTPFPDVDALPINRQEDLINERYAQDTKERKLLSHWVTIVVSLWLLFVLAILSLNRLLELKLSDTVLCMLLGTTTINILGLAYIVLKGLFDRKQ